MDSAPPSTSVEAGTSTLVIIGLIGIILTIAKIINWLRNIAPNSLEPLDWRMNTARRDRLPGLYRLLDHLKSLTENPHPQPSTQAASLPSADEIAQARNREVIRANARSEAERLLSKIDVSIAQCIDDLARAREILADPRFPWWPWGTAEFREARNTARNKANEIREDFTNARAAMRRWEDALEPGTT